MVRTPSPPVIDLEEAWVIRRVQEGDVDAFETLYRTHCRRVYGICRRITGDARLAEDLTQDVFLRVWERIGQFRGGSKFSTWLHRIATNRALDEVRAEIRRSAREIHVEDPASWDRRTDIPPTETRLQVDAAVTALPAAARAVFVLHDIEGFRHEEIAEMTGIAEGTSKSQLHRARKLLRERLQ